MTKLSTFPGVLGGGADDTAAIQAAFNSGATEIEYDQTYLHDTITVPNGVRRIFGSGMAKQRVGNSRIFEGTGVEDLTIEGLRIDGAYTQGQTNSLSTNDGIRFTSSKGIRVIGCRIRYIQNIAIHFMDCDDAVAHDNRILQCGLGIYLRGGRNQTISNNKIIDTLFAESVFTIAIALESTDGHSYGVPHTTIIDRNMIKGYRNAQGIMAHAAISVIMGLNTVEGAVIGMSVNPYNTTDEVSRIIMIGNDIAGPVSLAGYSGGNENIIAQGGPASGGGYTPSITDLIIGFNTTTNGNRAEGASNQGSIRVGYTKRTNVIGNISATSKGNGIIATADERSLNMSNNIVEEVIENAGQQNGILVLNGGITGKADNNMLTNMTGANAVGVKVTGSNPNLRVDPLGIVNVTTQTTGSWGASSAPAGTVPSRTISSGTACDLTDVDVIYFTHTSPTTINTWSGGIPGKEYKLVFLTDQVTIGRSNAWLNGSTSFTGGFDDVMTIIARTATDVRQMAPSSVNG